MNELDLYATGVAVVNQANPGTNYNYTGSEETGDILWYSLGQEKQVLLSYERFDDSLKFNKIGYVLALFWQAGNSSEILTMTPCASFDPATVAWSTKPEKRASGGDTAVTEGTPGTIFSVSINDERAVALLRSRSAMIETDLATTGVGTGVSLYSAGASGVLRPHLHVTYSDETVSGQLKHTQGPTSGRADRTKAITFGWSVGADDPDAYYVGTIELTSVKFSWRNGTSGDWTEIDCGTASSYTAPANAFPLSDAIQWKCEATDTTGATSSIGPYTIRTSDYPQTATPISPKDTIEDGSAPITLSWSVSSISGTLPTGADIQRADGSSYVDIAHIDSPAKSYVCPAGTFGAGSVKWRVRSYNADGVAGNWSSLAAFTCVAAPQTPSVSTSETPFLTVNWQTDGQQAFRVVVDGKDYGIIFGTEKEFMLPDYLEDGTHTVQVYALGEYGIWSQPGTVEVTIQNNPGEPVALSGSFGVDARLLWTSESQEREFYIYRDGKKIGSAGNGNFTDRVVLGSHEWYVVNVLPDGNYTKSNVVQGVLKSCETVIDTFQNPSGWMTLRLSAQSDTSQRFSYARTHSLRHFKGAALPLLEQSSFEDGSGTYDVSFTTVEEANAFETFKGKVVIIKSRGGNVVIGALNNLEKVTGDFFISYTFTVQRIYWEDYIEW